MYGFLIGFLLVFAMFLGFASAEEPRFATYHEIASVIVDQRISNNVTASISLQTTSIQEFQVPPELDAKIRNNTEIVAVTITNEDQCVLGVQEEICVLINSKRTPGVGITETQQKARQIGDSLISDINSAFGLKAQFHSVFVHYDDQSNKALETTGEVSGAGTVSAVYTAPAQNTDYMFNKISGVLIPRQIRQLGGFYDVAVELAKDDKSRMSFTILPKGEGSIMQLKVAHRYPHVAKDMVDVKPLEFLKVDRIKKSDYFSVGFFPLNSLVHVVILPMDNVTKAHADKIIEPTFKNGEKIPSDISANGWFFSSDAGQKVEAMYLFGQEVSASSDELKITFGERKETDKMELEFNEYYILIGIGAAAAGAAVYYLKGIRKS